MSYIPWYLKQFFWVVSEVMRMRVTSNGLRELSADNYLQYEGMAESLGLPTHEVMLCNFVYELFAHCTSIVSHYNNGEILHGRNMDYPLHKSMHDLTYMAHYYKNGQLLYKAVMFAGYSGVFTAMKPGKFAISINQRNSGTFLGVFINLGRWLWSSHSPASLLAITCEYANDYEEAKVMLSTLSLTAPVYYTISGTEQDEGAIITRDRSGSADIWLINRNSPTDWTIVQTNYDHWISPPPLSDKNRANSAKHALADIGQNGLSKDNMLSDVLQLGPVFNAGTIYSTVMSANRDLIQAKRYI